MPPTRTTTSIKRREAKQRELQELAATFFKYSQIYENMAATLRDHDPDEHRAAHERQSRITLTNRCTGPQTLEKNSAPSRWSRSSMRERT
ncbi:hypothetical protein Hypma_005550 [Hypsizygus marmoreus]|uniref:Uncharacterized protein n=1 Tax=Hypsizygus marmoreus TaxID=39966 RepID=A0A369JWC9_HYPMA|nr:hypothetical protein Hypma_005550 [Hypsizygus marmoreus]